jgi:hypothetical protein
MSEACVVIEQVSTQREWISTVEEIHDAISPPDNPSAFAFGLIDLCESRVSILCGTPSQPCSG